MSQHNDLRLTIQEKTKVSANSAYLENRGISLEGCKMTLIETDAPFEYEMANNIDDDASWSTWLINKATKKLISQGEGIIGGLLLTGITSVLLITYNKCCPIATEEQVPNG